MLLIPEGLRGVKSSCFLVFCPTNNFEVVVVTLLVLIAFSRLLINHRTKDTIVVAIIQDKPILQHSQTVSGFIIFNLMKNL